MKSHNILRLRTISHELLRPRMTPHAITPTSREHLPNLRYDIPADKELTTSSSASSSSMASSSIMKTVPMKHGAIKSTVVHSTAIWSAGNNYAHPRQNMLCWPCRDAGRAAKIFEISHSPLHDLVGLARYLTISHNLSNHHTTSHEVAQHPTPSHNIA